MGIKTKIALSFVLLTISVVVSVTFLYTQHFAIINHSDSTYFISMMVTIAILEILGFFILSYFWYKKISTPIQTLKESIEKVSEGQLFEIPSEYTKDNYKEIDNVVNSFNHMVNQLNLERNSLMNKAKEVVLDDKLKEFIKKYNNSDEVKEVVKKIIEPKTLEIFIPQIIGNSTEIIKIKELINNISDTESTVLITGERGTGKELIAKHIYKNSPRANHPFIKAKCSTISDATFENKMFDESKGFFKEAGGGTLFLDEIEELSLNCQAKLLSTLQDGIYQPSNSTNLQKINVRLICATNKNLKNEVINGNFREDLLYKITAVEIELPPLRKREGDIKLLAEYFINYYSKKYNRVIESISDNFFYVLEKYSWFGNIEQLENVIEKAIVLKKSTVLDSSDIKLPEETKPTQTIALPDSNLPLSETIDKVEKSIISQALQNTNGNYSKAASLLGITRQNLNYKLRKYKINKENL